MALKKQVSDKDSKLLMWISVFFLIIVKYSYYSYTYYPIADDNNMYGIFRRSKDIVSDIIVKYDTYTIRPIATSILDPYVWSKMWDCLGLALLIITVLHFLSCFFIYKIFEKSGLNMGLITIIVFTLLPCGSEATYWISASTRIVVGMFFMSLAFFCFCKFTDYSYDYLWFLGFIIFHLISLGFYEQLIVLNIFVMLILYISHWKKINKKWIIIFPIFNYVLIIMWYKMFSDRGNVATRGELIKSEFLPHLNKVLLQTQDLFVKNIRSLYEEGIIGGFTILSANKSYDFILFMLFLSFIVFYISYNEKFSNIYGKNIFKIFLGITLILVPLLPFAFLKIIWICNRNLFLGFIGLGLIIESILNMFLSRTKMLLTIRSALISLLTFVFLVGNIYELTFYQKVYSIDKEITYKISSLLDTKKDKSVILFNTQPSYVNTKFKRIENCTAADWMLVGSLKAQRENCINLVFAKSIPKDLYIDIEYNKVKSSLILGIDNNLNIFPLEIFEVNRNMAILYNTIGGNFGVLDYNPTRLRFLSEKTR